MPIRCLSAYAALDLAETASLRGLEAQQPPLPAAPRRRPPCGGRAHAAALWLAVAVLAAFVWYSPAAVAGARARVDLKSTQLNEVGMVSCDAKDGRALSSLYPCRCCAQDHSHSEVF